MRRRILFFQQLITKNKIIKYTALSKLIETTDDELDGLHTNAFNTTIKSHTFENGVGIIEFNDEVTNIGECAFLECTSLTSITIPNSVTSIDYNAFYHCTSLTNITIPNKVTSIGNYAFQYCSNLETIVCNATIAPTIQNSTFMGIKTNGILYVPIGSTGYNTWMGTNNYYLGKYNWTKIEQ